MTGRLGSMFSGIGALDLAVCRALDAEPVWHAQFDPRDRHQYAARILDRRVPGVPNLGDVRHVDWDLVPPIDVLAAGFPCQPVSDAGRKMVQQDDRWLWPYVAKAASVLRPRQIVLENVAALVRRGLPDVLSDLAQMGYDAEWGCLSASAVGAPHRRDRVFLLAWPASEDPDGQPGEQRRIPAPGQA